LLFDIARGSRSLIRAGHTAIFEKNRAAQSLVAMFSKVRLRQSWRSLAFLANQFVAIDQRPKNNHNRIITGIGTPSSQSKSPRPIVASLNPLLIQQREGAG
jgi:hypothetical protein